MHLSEKLHEIHDSVRQWSALIANKMIIFNPG
jgi:hypothetical protein